MKTVNTLLPEVEIECPKCHKDHYLDSAEFDIPSNPKRSAIAFTIITCDHCDERFQVSVELD